MRVGHDLENHVPAAQFEAAKAHRPHTVLTRHATAIAAAPDEP